MHAQAASRREGLWALRGMGIQVESASWLGHPVKGSIAGTVVTEANVFLMSGQGPSERPPALFGSIASLVSMSGAKAVLPVRPGGQT